MVTEESTETAPEAVVEETQATETVESTQDPVVEEAPAYEPNYAYKVYDEEREMEEWVRPLLTDKDTEEKVRGLLSKAGGFETLKEQHSGLKDEYGDVNQQYSDISSRIEELDHLMKNSPGAFFKEIGYTDEQIIGYVQELLARKDMSPQQLAQVQAQDQSLLDNFQNSRRTEMLEDQNVQLAKNAVSLSIDQALSAPEISNLQRSFDSRMGHGSFRKEIEAEGLRFHQVNGYDTTGPGAVQMAYDKWKPAFATGVPGAVSQVDDGKPRGVIPNIGSGDATASPTKPRATSIEALKKRYQEIKEA